MSLHACIRAHTHTTIKQFCTQATRVLREYINTNFCDASGAQNFTYNFLRLVLLQYLL